MTIFPVVKLASIQSQSAPWTAAEPSSIARSPSSNSSARACTTLHQNSCWAPPVPGLKTLCLCSKLPVSGLTSSSWATVGCDSGDMLPPICLVNNFHKRPFLMYCTFRDWGTLFISWFSLDWFMSIAPYYFYSLLHVSGACSSWTKSFFSCKNFSHELLTPTDTALCLKQWMSMNVL